MRVSITQSDIKELYSLMPNPRVREILILTNQRLVHFAVRKYFHGNKVDYDELVSRGNIGLIHAVDTYDITKGATFSTYGILNIYHEICKMFRDDVPKIETVSYDQLVRPDKDDSIEFGDLILTSDPDDSPERLAVYSDAMDRVYQVLKHLTEREQLCIMLWFGLNGHERRTQVQIANELGLSQAQVSRTCNQSIIKLRKLVGIE